MSQHRQSRLLSSATGLLLPLLLGACGPVSQADRKDEGEETPGEVAPENELEDESRRTRCGETEIVQADLRRLTASEFQSTLEDVFPEILDLWAGVALGTDPTGPVGFSNDSRLLVVGPQTAEEIFRTGGDVATLITSEALLPSLLPCSGDADRACAGSFIDSYGERMYRRTLSEVEREELLVYFDSVLGASDFPTAMKWMITGMIQSPFFVYRSEVGDASGKLSPEEVATQLSYIYLGSAPSQELLDRARAGELESAEARVAEARSMVATPAGQAVLGKFLSEWTGYEQVLSATKFGLEEIIVPLRESMAAETKAFFNHVLVDQGGSVSDLLSAPYTFTNDVLASHYGFGEAGTELALSQRPEGQGLGLLAQGSILSVASHANTTSPVFRGLFVFEKLLCNEKPPIPSDIDFTAVSEVSEANTTRERFEKIHSADSSCANCHAVFEPFGFALEDFDNAGVYRTMEGAFPIDAAASAPVSEGNSLSFDGTTDLAGQLAERPEVTDCVSGLMAAYTYSGGGGVVCLAEGERAALADGSLSLYEYYTQLAASPNMVERSK